MDTPQLEPYSIVMQGGPLDGRIIEGVTGDPMTPPDSVRHSQPGRSAAIYSPRPATGEGPLWVYVFIGYEQHVTE